MIEVRATYLVRMRDVNAALARWRRVREELWPRLGWICRAQQMLHGAAQQSAFVWSSAWPDVAAWQAATAAAPDRPADRARWDGVLELAAYGGGTEVFTVLAPGGTIDAAPGGVEVRSTYVVPPANVARARELARRRQERLWPVQGWSGLNQQRLQGQRAQSTFVWSSVWPSLGEWEAAMARTGGAEFLAWFADWKECVAFGAEREIFRNL